MAVSPRPEILKINPYRPGKPIAEVERELGLTKAIKLASNEATGLGTSPLALAAAHKALDEIFYYPESACPNLAQTLSQKLGFPTDQFIFGNGSNDLLELIVKTYLNCGDEVIFGFPTFIVYEIVTRMMGGEPVPVPLRDYAYDLEAIRARVTPKTKIIFVANPNNPTGTVIDPEIANNFVKNLPEGVLLCWDEAYQDFCDPGTVPDPLAWVRAGYDVLVTRTFAKSYGLAGLRCGFGVGNSALIEPMNRIRQPFNVNLVAQVAAEAALSDETYVKEHYSLIKQGREYYYSELDKMGLHYLRSQSNFVAIHVGADMMRIYEQLMREGLIVRPLAGWGMPEWIRVTISKVSDNEAFMNGLRRVLGK